MSNYLWRHYHEQVLSKLVIWRVYRSSAHETTVTSIPHCFSECIPTGSHPLNWEAFSHAGHR